VSGRTNLATSQPSGCTRNKPLMPPLVGIIQHFQYLSSAPVRDLCIPLMS